MNQEKVSSTASSSKPRAPAFPVRRPHFDFSGVRRFAYDDNALGSAFWGVLQALFPDGEKFFIRSVRDVRKRVDGPKLQREIDAFMGQEANHGRVHREVNEMAQKVHGVDLKSIERRSE